MAFFEFRHFSQTTTKALRADEPRGEKCLHQFPGEGMTDHEAAKTDQVQIVVLDALMRRKVFVNQAGPNPRHFVRADRCTNPAATNAHTAFHRPGGNRAGQRHDEIRIVIVLFRRAVAEINHFITGCARFNGQIFLQLVAAVAGGNADAVELACQFGRQFIAGALMDGALMSPVRRG